MWMEDLRWAWKLRDEKWQKERVDCKCNSMTTQEHKELLELYAADFENDIHGKDKATFPKCSKEEPVKDVTW